MNKLIKIVAHVRHAVEHSHKHRLKTAACASHVSYCSAVFIEGHGAYPILAGVMGLFIIIEFFSEEV